MKVRVVVGGTSYEVEIADLSARPIIAVVDGERFEIWPESSSTSIVGSLNGQQAPVQAALPPPSTPVSAPSASVAARSVERGAVLAPIPGVIVTVRVQPGDRVTAGQEVCVLEAMKMQNSIRAQQTGIVTAVHVSAGQHVKHHQPLVDIRPEE